MSEPLIFVTSETANVPTGRNVRAHARTESARLSNPPKAQQGRFSSFKVRDWDESGFKSDVKSSRKRRKQKAISTRCAIDSQQPVISVVDSKPCIGGLLEDALAIATFHIRRTVAQTALCQPTRLAQALRCRQWCHAIVPPMAPTLTPALAAAISCVEVRVRQVIFGDVSTTNIFAQYANALNQLRKALQGPTVLDLDSSLAACRFLAVYDMLGNTEGDDWSKHLDGASSLLKLSMSSGTAASNKLSEGELLPLLLDALLAGNDAILPNAPLQAILSSAFDSKVHKGGHQQLMSVIADALALIAEEQALRKNLHTAGPAETSDSIDRAYDIRSRLKCSILRNESEPDSHSTIAGAPDMLSLSLACLLAMDKVIDALEPARAQVFYIQPVGCETQQLCEQLLHLDLQAMEAHPPVQVLLAFRRSSSL